MEKTAGRLQYVRDLGVVNLTPVGRDIRRFFRSDPIMDMALDATGGGWLDGGCWTLAEGLRQWIGDDAELYCVVNRRDHSDQWHVVVRLFGADLYLDAEGLARRDEIMAKMRECEHAGPMEMLPFNPAHERPASKDEVVIEYYGELASDMAKALRVRFGAWADFRASVAAVAGHRLDPAVSGSAFAAPER